MKRALTFFAEFLALLGIFAAAYITLILAAVLLGY